MKNAQKQWREYEEAGRHNTYVPEEQEVKLDFKNKSPSNKEEGRSAVRGVFRTYAIGKLISSLIQ